MGSAGFHTRSRSWGTGGAGLRGARRTPQASRAWAGSQPLCAVIATSAWAALRDTARSFAPPHLSLRLLLVLRNPGALSTLQEALCNGVRPSQQWSLPPRPPSTAAPAAIRAADQTPRDQCVAPAPFWRLGRARDC